MKPVRNGLLSATIALGLLAVVSGNVQAQGFPFPINIPQVFTIQLTGVVQGHDTTNGTVVSTSATTVRIATKDILNLIADGYSTNFPSGSKLVLYGTDIYLVNKAGNQLEDLTSDGFLTILSSNGYVVHQGQIDYATCQLNTTYSFMVQLEFADQIANEIFDLYGLMQEKISLTAVDSHSNQKGSASFALTGESWAAVIGGADAIVSGKVIGSGKITGPAAYLCPL